MHVTLDEDGQVIRPNLIRDSSFEQSDALNVPGGWTLQGNGGIDTNQAWAKMGRRQFWVRSNAGSHAVVQLVDVTPHTQYRLTGWLRTGDSSGGGAGEGFLGVRQSGPGGVVVAEETFGDLDGWHKFVVEFDSGTHSQLEVYAGSTMTADRWVQGDNINLVATSDSEPPTSPSPSPTVSPTPSPSATAKPVDPAVALYTTPGFHNMNGRRWMTVCEPYSATARCWTFIWATGIHRSGDNYVKLNQWVFNNLTYVDAPKSLWVGNPLATPGSWTGSDGRAWRTECNTPATGGNGCRSYAEASVIEQTATGYRTVRKMVFNNIVRFR